MEIPLPATDTLDVLNQHHRQRMRRRGLLAILAVACLAALALGRRDRTFGNVTLADRHGLFRPDLLTPGEAAIVWQIRLPYALTAVLVGAALALSGAEMQTVLNNPLASPFTLGVSAAAAFGASLAIVLGLGLPFCRRTQWWR